MSKLNCMVAQSGGPTVAINASLAGVIDGVFESAVYDRIYGSVNGIYGILNGNTMDLTAKVEENPSFLSRLKVSPAMYLGSCRYKLPAAEVDETPYQTIFKAFEDMNIGAFFYIGGNDSMDTVMKLGAYGRQIGSNVRVIGVPKTIDNDLCDIDHTPGYGSAAKYVATTLLEIAHDTYIYKVPSVTIVEIMGRDAGWLTAASALARNSYSAAPDLIYLPEVAFDKDAFLNDLRSLLEKKDNVIVAVSEGIHDADGNYISATEAAADTFGHAQLSGAGKTLEMMVKNALGVKVRSVEINVLQRSAAHCASLTDLNESFELGLHAVKGAEFRLSEVMVTLQRESSAPYEVFYDYVAIDGIANAARSIPREWINEAGNDVTEEFITYAAPLVVGEPKLEYENGLPVYLDISHLV